MRKPKFGSLCPCCGSSDTAEYPGGEWECFACKMRYMVSTRNVIPIKIVKVSRADRPVTDEDLEAVQEELARIANNPSSTLHSHYIWQEWWRDNTPPGPPKQTRKTKGRAYPPPLCPSPEPPGDWGRSPADVDRKRRQKKAAKKSYPRATPCMARPSRKFAKAMTKHGTGKSAVYTNDKLIQQIFGSPAVRRACEAALAAHIAQEAALKAQKAKLVEKDTSPLTLRDRVVINTNERKRWRRKYFLS